jgi:hypothetical protein
MGANHLERRVVARVEHASLGGIRREAELIDQDFYSQIT